MISIKRSFAFRLSIYTITCVVIVFVGVLFYNYRVSKQIITEHTSEHVRHVSELAINHVDAILIPVKTITEYIADIISLSNISWGIGRDLTLMLQSTVQSNPSIYGIAVAFEPYRFDKDKYYSGLAFCKTTNGIKSVNIGTFEYDYFKRDWFTEPKKLGHGVWSEPHLGTEGKLTIAYSQPIFKNINGKKEFVGVVECDIALDWLITIVSNLNYCDLCENGYAFLLSLKGNFIVHPNKQYEGKSFFTLNPDKKLLGEDMISGKTGHERFFSRTLNKVAFTFYRPMKSTEWTLGIVITEEELLSNL